MSPDRKEAAVGAATATAPGAEDSIFDASAFDLPIPELDGCRSDKLVMSFSGQVELDRTSEDDLAFIEALKLGRDVDLQVTASIAKKGFSHTAGRDDGPDTIGYGVSLKVHSLDVPERS